MDENGILGTSGKDALPFEYQAQEQANLRKRAMAQMMLQKSMAPMEQMQNFGGHVARRSPFEAINKAIQGYLGQKGLADVDSDQQATMARAADDQKSQIANFMALQQSQSSPIMGEAARPTMDTMGPMQGTQVGTQTTPGNPKAAIAAALSSPFPNVQAMGTALQKNDWANDTQKAGFAQEELMRGRKAAEDRQNKIGELYSKDPQMAAQLMQNGIPAGGAPAMAAPTPTSGVSAHGDAFTYIPNRDGSAGSFHYAPKETKVTNTTNVAAARTDTYMDKLAADRIGEGVKALSDAPAKMAQLNRLNTMINKGSDQGSGADMRQTLREYGNMLGVSVPQGGLTSATQGIYNEQLLAAVRALAPVTEKDIPMAQKLIGSASTNPAAMKELIAWTKAKVAVSAAQHNNQVEQAAVSSSGNPNKYDQFKVPTLPLATGDKQNDARTKQLIRDAGTDTKQFGQLPDAPDVDYFAPGARIYPDGSAGAAAAQRKGGPTATPMPEGFTNRRKF